MGNVYDGKEPRETLVERVSGIEDKLAKLCGEFTELQGHVNATDEKIRHRLHGLENEVGLSTGSAGCKFPP